jgi:hypothetical protein
MTNRLFIDDAGSGPPNYSRFAPVNYNLNYGSRNYGSPYGP